MNSLVFRIFILASLASSEWVQVPFVLPKSQGIMENKSAFSQNFGNRSNKLSCPDIHNYTMKTYLRARKLTGELDFEESWSLADDSPASSFHEAQKESDDSDEKLGFLKSAETTLIAKIEEKIKRFGMTREARGKHVDFPSMESALITISLLLFAVYLIKLVMKILQSLQAKKGQMQMTSTAGLLVQGRKKRSFDKDLDHIKLMHMIDKYNLLFN